MSLHNFMRMNVLELIRHTEYGKRVTSIEYETAKTIAVIVAPLIEQAISDYFKGGSPK